MSKIIRIFLIFFFIEEYQFRGTFLKHFSIAWFRADVNLPKFLVTIKNTISKRTSTYYERVLLWRSSWKWTLRGGNEFHLPWQFEVKGGEMIKRPRTKSFADESRSLSIFGVLACNVQKKKQKWVQRTLVLKIAVVYCMFCKEVKGWPRNAYFFWIINMTSSSAFLGSAWKTEGPWLLFITAM